MNGLATLAFIFCYHPPTFEAKHGKKSKLEFIKHFDYLGTFIIVLGLLLFLMGLSWGGTVYPWRSAHVIACMVVGALLTIGFFLYEAFMPLKEPLLPMYLLKNTGWDVTVIIWAIGESHQFGVQAYKRSRDQRCWSLLRQCPSLARNGILYVRHWKRRTNVDRLDELLAKLWHLVWGILRLLVQKEHELADRGLLFSRSCLPGS